MEGKNLEKRSGGITRRKFLRLLVGTLLGLFLGRTTIISIDKKSNKQKEAENNIEEIFGEAGGPETLGEYYEELIKTEELKNLKHPPTKTPTATPSPTPTPSPTATPKTPETISSTPETIKTKIIYRGKPGTKKIAITFDDSANPNFLRRLLEIAKKHNVKMVWFLIGRTVTEEVKQIIIEGVNSGFIRIGNHSFSHNISEFSKLNPQYIEKEKNEWLTKFKELGFEEEKLKLYFRPPGGAGGYRGGDKNLLQVLSENGYQYLCMWDTEFIYTIRKYYEGKYIKENVLDILRKRIYSTEGGNLVLFHFNNVDIEALEDILEKLKSDGYEFVFPEEL